LTIQYLPGKQKPAVGMLVFVFAGGFIRRVPKLASSDAD
jgi:hypothetical protein